MFTHSVVARRQLVGLLGRDDREIDLAQAALIIATEEYAELDPCRYRRWLDLQATRVRERSSDDPVQLLDVTRSVLFDQEGFRGNSDDYYDPRNSFLNDVIDRKIGIPLTLSIVFLEVCWRVGLAALGVGLPGHFIVAVEAKGAVLVDPFNGGSRLTVEDCDELVRRSTGGSIAFTPRMLRPMSRRQILTRMLNNLKNIYFRNGDDSRLLAVLDRLLLIEPRSISDYYQRALVSRRVHFYGQALADCRRYLDMAPSGPESLNVRATLSEIDAALGWKN